MKSSFRRLNLRRLNACAHIWLASICIASQFSEKFAFFCLQQFYNFYFFFVKSKRSNVKHRIVIFIPIFLSLALSLCDVIMLLNRPGACLVKWGSWLCPFIIFGFVWDFSRSFLLFCFSFLIRFACIVVVVSHCCNLIEWKCMPKKHQGQSEQEIVESLMTIWIMGIT